MSENRELIQNGNQLACECPTGPSDCHNDGRYVISLVWEDGYQAPGLKCDFTKVCSKFKQCILRKGKAVSLSLEASGIPNSYMKPLENFNWGLYRVDTSDKQKVVNRYIEHLLNPKIENMRGLYIWSRETGTGKTKLASCILHDIHMKYGVNVKMVQVASLIDESKKPLKNPFEKPYIDKLKECDVLVLDDVKESRNEWMNNLLFEILDTRYAQNRSTIITSNIPKEELSSAIDDRIASRIYAMCEAISLPDVSIRDMKAEMEHNKLLREALI